MRGHEVDWYHGSSLSFSQWQFPPPPNPFRLELRPHTAVFLTTDLPLAKAAGRNLCSARLRAEARVLDLRVVGQESDELRRHLLETELGRHCVRTHDAAVWWSGWNTGEAMRFAPDDSEFSQRYMRLVPAAERAMAGSRDADDRRAWLVLQNLTREWIELVAVTARVQGFDALLGNEIDSKRPDGSKACGLLCALTERALTAPHWITGPKRKR